MRQKKVNPTPDQLSLPEMKTMIYIERYTEMRRQPPSIREIADMIDLSVGATHDLINRLIDYGYLARKSNHRMRRNLAGKLIVDFQP